MDSEAFNEPVGPSGKSKKAKVKAKDSEKKQIGGRAKGNEKKQTGGKAKVKKSKDINDAASTTKDSKGKGQATEKKVRKSYDPLLILHPNAFQSTISNEESDPTKQSNRIMATPSK